ncbi:MAG: dihydropteroate synthase [Deltaproteobacteria bacterium]
MARVHDLLKQAARQRTAALMGIVNVTPDSFYDGGCYETPGAARERVGRLLAEGADILDIGGESSKPGAPRVSAEQQIERIRSALACAVELGALISVDTASPAVASFALAHGAHVINDVTCLSDPQLATVVAQHDAVLIVSHARAHQSEMRDFSEWPDADYSDVAAEVKNELALARERAVARGVRHDQVWFDPGLGFSKNARHSIELLSRVAELASDGTPVVVGAGRKSFIKELDGSGPADRLGGTIAASVWASRQGAQLVRVHDVAAVRQALLVEAALERPARVGASST